MSLFKLNSKFKPAGDQPNAIKFLSEGVVAGEKHQTLLGITGSGKTFAMANIIKNTGKPTLILSHNKTLAAQLFSEFQEFFPENHVEYFVSYYDYYQPEAYVPRRGLYIEKEVDINENIERYRSSATQTLLTEKDVIVIATVSCIYGLGNPEDYMNLSRTVRVGETYEMVKLYRHLADLQYERRSHDFHTGTYRVRGDTVDINTAAQETAVRLEFFGDEVDSIKVINPISGEIMGTPEEFTIFPAKAYVTPYEALKDAIPRIQDDLDSEVKAFTDRGLLVEAERLRQRVSFDIEMLQETGYVSGIENYSRYIENRPIGSPPSTLLDYFPGEWLMFIDESHITVPQIGGMYNGDLARKKNLVEHGFRMKSAFDNRPLKFEEFTDRTQQVVYVSATPADYEIDLSNKNERIVHQIIRPTGLLDPHIDIRPSEGKYLRQLNEYITENGYSEMTHFNVAGVDEASIPNQIDDLLEEIRQNIQNDERTLVTTLTKRMSENLSKFLQENGIKTAYLHSDIDTIERVEILRDLRLGIYDVLVGINLLREGLDLPEVSMVAIIDADKEGFLRSKTSLIQTIGRAARHHKGKVVMYADKITKSMKFAIDTTRDRRQKQIEHNEKHGITPKTIKKDIRSQLERSVEEDERDSGAEIDLIQKYEIYPSLTPKEKKQYKKDLEVQMNIYADSMEFEKAAKIRDLIKSIKK